jgi:glutamine amidotransferase
MKCCLFAMRDSIREPASGGARRHDGFGLGFYQNGEVLLQKKPQWGNREVDYYDIAKELKTDAFVGHVRKATVGAWKHENSHPFRFRNWLFAHNGTIAHFDAVKPRMLEAIPDFLRRNVRGDTDSEHLFHLFLTLLQERGKMDDPNIDVRIVRDALRTAVSRLIHWVSEAGPDAPHINIVAMNGRVMVAVRYGRPLHAIRQVGFPDCTICRSPSEPEKRAPHDLLRFAAVASEMSKVAPGWAEVPERSLVSVNRAIDLEMESL